jgi:putative Mg2+ transporter-C (MgtC) family protein
MSFLPWENLIRLLVAFLLGSALGLERELNKKPAGLRTHVVISLASALYILLSINAVFGGGAADPARIASQVVVGMGFVGAGVIISTGGQVRGVTTASSLWLTAVVGMASGLGEFTLGIVHRFSYYCSLGLYDP